MPARQVPAVRRFGVSPATIAAFDREMRDAVRRMRPVLPRRTPGRWVFDNVLGGDRLTCWAQLREMIDMAADRGKPLDDVLAIARVFEAYSRARHDEHQRAQIRRSLEVRLVDVAETDAAEDVARAKLQLTPHCPEALHRFVDAGMKQLATLKDVVQHAQSKLFHHTQRSA